MVRRIIRILTWMLAVLLVLTAGLYVYLRSADLSVYQDQIEAFVARQIGHELQVGGRFELQFGPTTRLVAEDAVLTNPDWADNGELIRVGHLTFAFNTWSLFSRPFLVEELTARDISGNLLRDESGRVNWISERVEPPQSDGAPPDLTRIAFRMVNIEGIEFLYEDPARPFPIVLAVEVLTVSPDDAGILDLDLRGNINDLPLWADGKVGPWHNFIDGRDIFADLDLTLGQARLSLEGTVADLVGLEGIALTSVLSGPAIERVLERLGVPEFASGAFTLTGDIQQQDVGHLVRLDGNLGQMQLFASGSADKMLRPSSVNYDFSISGPSSGAIAELAGIEGLPATPFHLSGDYSRENSVISFDEAVLRTGENTLGFEGDIDLDSLNLDLTMNAEGPDFSIVGLLMEVPGLPQEPFAMRGRVRRDGSVWQAAGVTARIGDNRLTINGELETGSPSQAQIALEAAGPDISVIQDFTDLEGIPDRPYDVDVIVRSHPRGVELVEGTGVFGENRIEASGIVALGPGLHGTTGSVRLSGPDFHNVALLSGVPYLPAGAFDIAGSGVIEGDAVRLAEVTATVGEISATAAGTVDIAGDEVGRFGLDVSLQGPDLASLPEIQGLDDFAGEPFRLAGHISRNRELITVTDLDVSVGNLDATLNGAVVGAAEHVRMSVAANSENSLMLRKIAKLSYLPDGALLADGNIEMSNNEIRFADTVLELGDYRAAANGNLSMQPRSNDSDLVFTISGPSLREAGLIGGINALPEKDFSVSGEFVGTPTGFEMRDFVARVGDNNLHGEFDARLEGKPQVVGMLSSARLDLSDRLQQAGSKDQVEESPGVAQSAGDGRLFSDEPLVTSGLQVANIDIELKVDELISNALTLTDVDVGIKLQDGALRVDPFFLREQDGSIAASFSLAPVDGQYALQFRIEVDEVHAGLLAPGDDDSSSLPTVSGKLQFAGAGATIRSIMASSNGNLAFRQGPGKVREVFGSALFRDVLLEVLRTLNPLSRSRDFQLLECGIYEISIKEGLATIDRFIIQTDSMTTVARGEVNLANERLEIAFRAKPREGIGISLGTVANQLLEVRGTLASPRIRLDAGRTATTTGAAVATGGLSLLARGLWDRLSAEGDLCKQEANSKQP